MQQDILKNSNFNKIYFCYVDGKNIQRKITVTIKYMDTKSCYFVGEIPVNFTKPKWRTKAEIIVYTTNGKYSTTLIIRDTNFSLQEVVYKVDLPKAWSFSQLRAGTRKKLELPVKIKFNDGLEIEAKTFDVSVGGFSIITKENLSTIHTRFASNCKILFPNDSTLNFPDDILESDCIYVRMKNNINMEFSGSANDKLICFKFLKLSSEKLLILKKFLMQ